MTRTQENIALWLIVGIITLVVAATPIITAPLPDAAAKRQCRPASDHSSKLPEMLEPESEPEVKP